jgi:hypothetical protein
VHLALAYTLARRQRRAATTDLPTPDAQEAIAA